MGVSLSKVFGKIFGDKELRVLMLGLDAAGKTSKYVFPLKLLSNFVQIKIGARGVHGSHNRIQCGNCTVQKSEI
jgi:hypothetical protein